MVEHLADPDRFSGGGVVAGVTLAAATATVQLVARLATRRKSLADRREFLVTQLDELTDLRQRFLDSPDRDLTALAELLDAQREARAASHLSKEAAEQAGALVAAKLQVAAETPLALIDDGLSLLALIEAVLPLATRFTVSDLGAAAAMAAGAIEAAGLMSEVNLSLMTANEDTDRLRRRLDAVLAEAKQRADTIVEQTRVRIAGRATGARR